MGGTQEEKAYQPIPIIHDFLDDGGNDIMCQYIQYNYDKIKVDVMDIIEEEIENKKDIPGFKEL